MKGFTTGNSYSFLRKVRCFVLGALLSISILSGCTSSGSNTTSRGTAKEITVGAEAGSPYTGFYKSIASEFTTQTGIKVKFLEVPHENMHQRFITEAAAGTGAIDVYQVDQPWISEFAAKGFLDPLDNRISKDDLADFTSASLNTVKYQNHIYGLPYLVHTPIVYYRKDLFQQAGITHPPQTWNEFRADAKKLTEPNNGIYGTVVEGKQAPEPVTHLIDMIMQAGGSVLDDQNHVTFDSPQVLNAFKYMLALQYDDHSSPPGAVSYENADVDNLFMQGKVAMAIDWPYLYSLAQDPKQSKVAGKFGVALQPGDVQNTSSVWSWGYGISSSSKNKDAAWEFVKWATSSSVVKRFGEKFVNPVARKSALEAIKADPKLNKDDLQSIALMSDAAARGKNAITTPKFPQIQDRLTITLSAIMSRQGNPENVVKTTAADLQNILSNS